MKQVRFRILSVDNFPKESNRLGLLVYVEFVEGSIYNITPAPFKTATNDGTWQLTSIAHTDTPHPSRLPVAFKWVSGSQILQAGMELIQATPAG